MKLKTKLKEVSISTTMFRYPSLKCRNSSIFEIYISKTANTLCDRNDIEDELHLVMDLAVCDDCRFLMLQK